MSAPAIVPRHMAQRKPPHGHPCNRCGVCCYVSLCDLGKHMFGHISGPCPALEVNGTESTCRLASQPQHYAPKKVQSWGLATMAAAARKLIGTGTGCDACINGEARNEVFYKKLRIWDRQHKDEVALARKLWGM